MVSRIESVDIYDVNFSQLARPYNFVIVRIRSSDGFQGIGEVSMIYGDGAKAAAAHIAHLAAKYLVGELVDDQARIWQRVARESFWQCGAGPIHWGSVSALDIALWDLRGRREGKPIHALLGGALRDELEVYVNGWYGSAVAPEEFASAAKKVVDEGYTGLKFDPFRMSATGRMAFSPRQVDESFARLAVARVRAVREAIGPTIKLMLDLHGSLGVSAAKVWGRHFAEYDLFFYEDAVDTEHPELMRELKTSLPVRIACGDRLYCRTDVLPYLERRAIDVLQVDVGLAGGFSETQRIGWLADTYQVDMALHNCAGPINTAASVQLSASLPNFLIQECFPYWKDDRYDIVEAAPERNMKRCTLPVPQSPGLGVDLNEEFMRRWPCVTVNQIAGRTTA